jgi:FtsP/CotA-like multicopper oxidase with cupredoxin domain
VNRREFAIKFGSVMAASMAQRAWPLPHSARMAPDHSLEPADHTLHIRPMTLDLGNGIQIRTVGYNGSVPGPVLRLKEGSPVEIDVFNDSDTAEIVHWHGLAIDPLNDGAMEEGSPMISPGGRLRYNFTPKPAGTRWYHTHASAGMDLSRATYSGQFGFLIVESGREAGDYDREVLLAVHHWEPTFMPMGPGQPCEVSYKHASFNDKVLSAAEPIKVRRGERVLFRFLNASATENVVLALPGHRFKVIALDGNPVPHPKEVSVLSLAVAERVDAVVEMDTPGVWVLGSTNANEREIGLGIPIEYAGSSGQPIWYDPSVNDWDYRSFGGNAAALTPDETFPMVFQRIAMPNGAPDAWTINGHAFPNIPPLKVKQGRRYRLGFYDASGCPHPVHLHRHSFDVLSINGQPTSGLVKDVINLTPYGTAEVDFVADNPGPTLFHCHQQLHMDGGFMQLIKYVTS